mgnify:CR=1 FL=1
MRNKYAPWCTFLLWIEAAYFIFVNQLLPLLLRMPEDPFVNTLVLSIHIGFGLILPVMLFAVGMFGLNEQKSGRAVDGRNRSVLAIVGSIFVFVMSAFTLYVLLFAGLER